MSTDQLQLKHPIVLIHGLGARSSYGPFEYFYGLPKLLRDAKNKLLIANLTSWNTIDHRAQQLKEQIEKVFPDEKVNLVGHSMGGLDARFLTAQLGRADYVASVTTIGTPNRGSCLGDIGTGILPDSAFSAADRVLSYLDANSGAFRQITREYCQGTLAELAPMMPNVAYYSATSAIRTPFRKTALPIFWIPSKILQKIEGDNDGFVSVESAKWGEHICTYVGDHYGQIGQFLGRSRGLNYIAFYTEIFRRLKKDGM